MASRAIFSNFFEEQSTQNHPQYLSGLSRALFPTTFLETAVNTTEIPGELSRENLISSHVKISPLLWLHDKSRLSHQQLKRNGLVFHWRLYNK